MILQTEPKIKFKRHGTLIQMERIEHVVQSHLEIGVFGKGWALISAEIPPLKLYALSDGHEIEIQGEVYAFIPPFSIIHWRKRPGIIRYKMLIGTHPLLGDIWKKALVFPQDGKTFPTSQKDVDLLLQFAHEPKAIERTTKSGSVADRTKNYIKHAYVERCKLETIANDLGVRPSTVTKAFKFEFGLTPMNYLNRLRMVDSIRFVIDGKSIADAAHEVGFGELCQYYTHAKKYFQKPPRKFFEDSVSSNE